MMVNLTIRLSKSSAGDGSAAVEQGSGEPSVTVSCPDHLVLADLPVAKGLGLVANATVVKIVGRKGRRRPGDKVHFCVRCNFPISVYGRLDPCQHAFCLTCARRDSSCYLCDERILRIQRLEVLEGVFICGAPRCLRSFIKKQDFQLHIKEVHEDLIEPAAEKDEPQQELTPPKVASSEPQLSVQTQPLSRSPSSFVPQGVPQRHAQSSDTQSSRGQSKNTPSPSRREETQDQQQLSKSPSSATKQQEQDQEQHQMQRHSQQQQMTQQQHLPQSGQHSLQQHDSEWKESYSGTHQQHRLPLVPAGVSMPEFQDNTAGFQHSGIIAVPHDVTVSMAVSQGGFRPMERPSLWPPYRSDYSLGSTGMQMLPISQSMGQVMDRPHFQDIPHSGHLPLPLNPAPLPTPPLLPPPLLVPPPPKRGKYVQNVSDSGEPHMDPHGYGWAGMRPNFGPPFGSWPGPP